MPRMRERLMPRRGRRFPAAWRWALVSLTWGWVGPGAARAEGAQTARGWLPVALHAADAWADDARLVWVENDAPVDPSGRAEAWGYLFYSPLQHAMRSYSVRGGALAAAKDQAVSVAAPGLDAWLDSGAVLDAAFRRAASDLGPGPRLLNLLLVRGVFAREAAWVAVFVLAEGPRLFVVCDAQSGDVLRAWRG